MTLIDRYLHAVRSHLPGTRQDDIIRELSDDLHAQVADREEELGRPLTDDEQADFLRKLGHPLVFAARYRTHQHLIGPVLFPIYWQALKISIGIALAVHVALAIASAVSGADPGRAIGPIVVFPFGPAITVFGWVTIIFAIISATMPHLSGLAEWNPKTLPAVPSDAPPRHWATLAEIVFATIILLWWLAVPGHPFLIFGPGAAIVALAPVWDLVHLPIAVLGAISVVSLWTFLLRPDWARYRAAGRLINSAMALVIQIVLYRAPEIVTLAAGAPQTDGTLHTIDALNRLLRLCVLFGMAASCFELGRGLYRRLRAR